MCPGSFLIGDGYLIVGGFHSFDLADIVVTMNTQNRIVDVTAK